ncbi:XF1762 family protein [Streptomyces olivaceus]|uniref:XF1762 family protein n=1 Tax=Streptomyces olivaceus TaxID=47716 RepID=UPI0035562F48
MRTWHRHHPPPAGPIFAVGAADETGILRAVAIVGRPVARHLDDGLWRIPAYKDASGPPAGGRLLQRRRTHRAGHCLHHRPRRGVPAGPGPSPARSPEAPTATRSRPSPRSSGEVGSSTART